MIQITLPAVGNDGEPTVFESRPASPLEVVRRARRSILDLAPLFRDDDILSVRLGPTTWHIGRSPEWTRHVIGSRSLWADLDILPLGLGQHPTYYAMGGLPGAPPERHRLARRTAVTSGFHGAVDEATLKDSMALATELALDPASHVLDVELFARALFLRMNAATVAGLDIDAATTVRILAWFDRWTKIMSNPLSVLGQPRLPFTPAGRLRGVLAPWYDYLADVLHHGAPGVGLVPALQRQLGDGEITVPEAVGYLATVLFAGTEPPAHTLLWAYAHCVAADPQDLGVIDSRRAEVLLWESFRVRPAVNVVVRRVAGDGYEYRSGSSDVYVVAPPLTHQRSNARHLLPPGFTPAAAGSTRFDPDEYPGLGTGAHHCVGARLGMHVARQALLFLLNDAEVVRPPDLAATGIITSQPRRLPVVTL